MAVRESVALQAVLAPAVALLTQLVRPRTKRVDYRPPPAVSVTVDRAQVIYGLSNLFRALARGLGDTGRIVVGYEDGRIVIELPTGFDPSDAHLASLVGTPQLSSPSSLAAAIAQRSRGTPERPVVRRGVIAPTRGCCCAGGAPGSPATCTCMGSGALVTPPNAKKRLERAKAFWALMETFAKEAVDLVVPAVRVLKTADLIAPCRDESQAVLARVLPALRAVDAGQPAKRK